MSYDFKLESTEYVEGHFKKYEESSVITEKLNIEIGVEVGIGTMFDNVEKENVSVGTKTKFRVEVTSKEEKKLAVMDLTYIFIFQPNNEEFISKLVNEELREEELNSSIKKMTEQGYLNIRGFIEKTFLKAKMPLELPYDGFGE